jgi:uncharacterized protein YbbC (DUF1343 family)
MKLLTLVLFLAGVHFLLSRSDTATEHITNNELSKPIITGADQVNEYLPLIRDQRVGMLVNITSIIGQSPSVDSLLKLGVDIKLIFGPEHGFRANASNGAKVADEIDPETGIPIISLYGKKRKPSKEDMDAIDIMIFDIADVGCRFYTNINTLAEVMDACAEHNKELIILDRPNPNGYVDGPVLDMQFKSGIGKFPIPVTHGMTIGEFAQMINGQGWLPENRQCKIKVIAVKNYRHDIDYTMPVSPSPNLNTQQSVILYPSLCLFEGTIVSQGRGTYMPFTVLGAPALKGHYEFSFTPVSIQGKSESPLHMNEVCYGLDLRGYDISTYRQEGKINIQWMIEMYQAYPDKDKFFDRSYSKQMGNIDYLAGTDQFKKQIINGTNEQEIRASWEPGLSEYKEMRKKYLLYP